MLSPNEILDATRDRVINCSLHGETSVLDYKLIPHKTKEHICEFLKDILSLLNSYERPNDDRYLVYGVDSKANLARGYEGNLALDDADYQGLFSDYISPRPTIEFHQYGWEDIFGSPGNDDLKFACFYIPSSIFGDVYELKKQARDKEPTKNFHRNYEVGTSFIRTGSRVEPMTQRDRIVIQSTKRQLEQFNLDDLSDYFDQKGYPVFALAALLGSWDESNKHDREFIERVSGCAYDDWIAPIRKRSFFAPGTFSFKGSKWVISQRQELLEHFKVGLSKQKVDSLLPDIKTVLNDVDSRYDEKAEDRFLLSAFGPSTAYSSALKEGLSNFVAIMGSRCEKVCTCRSRDVRNAIFALQESVLLNDNWKVIASANGILPILAEAYLEGYLILVERAAKPDSGLAVCLTQKTGSFGNDCCGGSLFTGIRYAASTVDLFAQSITTLLKLRAFSRVADETLEKVLLPWNPQTNASVDARKAAVNTILDSGAWESTLHLLPHVTTSGSWFPKPLYRSDIVPDRTVTWGEFWDVSKYYASAAIDRALLDNAKIHDLIKHMNAIAEADQIEHLMSVIEQSCENLKEFDSFAIWSELDLYLRRCKKYADASWAPKKTVLSIVSKTVDKLKPTTELYKAMHLFIHDDFELVDEDWATGSQKLNEDRIAALNGLPEDNFEMSITELAKHCKNKRNLGYSLAFAFSHTEQCDAILYPQMENKGALVEVSVGYVRGMYQITGIKYLETPTKREWDSEAIGLFFSSLPCVPEVWTAAEAALGEEGSKYWKASPECFDEVDKQEANHALSQFTEVGRHADALLFSYRCINRGVDINPTLLLDAICKYNPDSKQGLEVHFIGELCNYLETSGISLDEIAWQQFRLYPLLEEKESLAIHRHMAADPAFFSKILALAFLKPDEKQSNRSSTQRAYEVLWRWHSIPGLDENGFHTEVFDSWVDKARVEAIKNDLLDAFDYTLGECLFHSPSDDSGLFINIHIAKFLDCNDMALSGYSVESVNSRGASWVDGKGTEHLSRADQYSILADELERIGLMRFAAKEREMARDSKYEAEREIEMHDSCV